MSAFMQSLVAPLTSFWFISTHSLVKVSEIFPYSFKLWQLLCSLGSTIEFGLKRGPPREI